MAALSAAEQVLSTPELLETILLYLDQASLLTSALRINHLFHSLITNSPSLQEHLFLRARRPRRWDSLLANPLVFATLPVRFYYQELVSERRFRRDPDPGPVPGPGRHKDRNVKGDDSPTTGLDVYRRIGPRVGEGVVDDRRSDWDLDDPFTRPEASWRRMLAVQPVLAASASSESTCSGGSGGSTTCGGSEGGGRKRFTRAAEAAYYTSHYDYLQRLHLMRGTPLPPESFLAVQRDLRMARVVARARRILAAGATPSPVASSMHDNGSGEVQLFGIKFMMYEGDVKAAAGGGWARGGGALQQDGIEFRTRRGGKRLVFLRTDFPPGAPASCCEGQAT